MTLIPHQDACDDVATPDDGASETSPVKDPDRVLRDKTYLIIDDKPYSMAMTKGFLKTFGMTRQIDAVDAIQGYRILRDEAVDLVLVSYEMPFMNGIDFTIRVRQDAESPDPRKPVIVLSWDARESTVLEAINAGVNEFMVKPLSATALYERVRSTLLYPRPFIQTAEYFGPDRRLRNIGPDGREKRLPDE
ncbi:MAG: response regulator [Rhodospirillales bacterium]|nr:response regulator [Rhodospirillales bacterium]